jgi:hypothetical protein
VEAMLNFDDNRLHLSQLNPTCDKGTLELVNRSFAHATTFWKVGAMLPVEDIEGPALGASSSLALGVLNHKAIIISDFSSLAGAVAPP